ncbi:hypothetical protein BH160DRAFT_4389 [Burkholderia sp. H160]|nr:hypothetical protein BH160DRAFT_4389 [Burkholderia sp. H160]
MVQIEFLWPRKAYLLRTRRRQAEQMQNPRGTPGTLLKFMDKRGHFFP